jgi:hypothetical protein
MPQQPASGEALLRSSLAAVDDADLERVVAGVPPGAVAGEPPAVQSAFRWLRRRRGDVKGALKQCGLPVLALLAEAVCDECLAETIELLGEHAANPDHEQLTNALGRLSPRHTAQTVDLMLAFVVATRQPAAGVCRQLLEERRSGGSAEAG